MAKGKYTPELADQIIRLIKAGNFASVAYGACGISKDTYFRWLKEYKDFNDSIKKAKKERIASLVLAIKSDGAWVSKAWMLERLDRQRFHLPTGAEKDLLERIEKLEALAKQNDKWEGIERPQKIFEGGVKDES